MTYSHDLSMKSLGWRAVTGAEIVAAGKAAEAVGKKTLAGDQKTKDALLRVAEGTPEMAAAARNMAARIAVTERVKLKLYQPFARMLGVSKEYFEDAFPQEMGARIANIPEENLISPAASVAVPVLQGLSYSFDEASLKNMYLNLLGTASDDRRADQAHPAFADVIRQLTPDEARHLNVVLASTQPTHAIARVIGPDSSAGALMILMSDRGPFSSGESQHADSLKSTWVDNWQRLGLVNVSYSALASRNPAYDWVLNQPEYIQMATSSSGIGFAEGELRVADFGRQFFRAVV